MADRTKISKNKTGASGVPGIDQSSVVADDANLGGAQTGQAEPSEGEDEVPTDGTGSDMGGTAIGAAESEPLQESPVERAKKLGIMSGYKPKFLYRPEILNPQSVVKPSAMQNALNGLDPTNPKDTKQLMFERFYNSNIEKPEVELKAKQAKEDTPELKSIGDLESYVGDLYEQRRKLEEENKTAAEKSNANLRFMNIADLLGMFAGTYSTAKGGYNITPGTTASEEVNKQRIYDEKLRNTDIEKVNSNLRAALKELSAAQLRARGIQATEDRNEIMRAAESRREGQGVERIGISKYNAETGRMRAETGVTREANRHEEAVNRNNIAASKVTAKADDKDNQKALETLAEDGNVIRRVSVAIFGKPLNQINLSEVAKNDPEKKRLFDDLQVASTKKEKVAALDAIAKKYPDVASKLGVSGSAQTEGGATETQSNPADNMPPSRRAAMEAAAAQENTPPSRRKK